MTVLTKGAFSLNIGLVKMEAELSEIDRQCAWELYTELSTRIALTGKTHDEECTDFSGELFIESLSSLYIFFQEARLIMRKFPVGMISGDEEYHLGLLISRMMEEVLRPFLEKWHVHYRYWWESVSNPRLPPMGRQNEFTDLEDFLNDWSALRWLLRKVRIKLKDTYRLVNL